ncbi:MAG: peptidylprolyl isomerase [Candidatus Nanopelagicus sp.]
MNFLAKSMISSFTILLISTAIPTSANATPSKKASALNCKTPTAKGHSIKNIELPQVKAFQKNSQITLSTNCGEIVIEADPKDAPVTVAAITALAKGGFFNQTICHRLTKVNSNFLHCGDPTATGMGGPNFEYENENLPKSAADNYPEGTVAIWNSKDISNGSQFFIVYADSTLPANYSIWGKVVKGIDIVKAIAKEGVVGGSNDGLPKRTLAIEKVKVR